MKLDIDLNKLTLDELNTILDIAKKQKYNGITEEINNETKKPIIYHKKKYDWDTIIPKMKEYIHNNKKPTRIGKLLDTFNILRNGENYKKAKKEICKDSTIRLIAPTIFSGIRYGEKVKVSKSKLSSRRGSFLMKRANTLMFKNPQLSRQQAYIIASQEWNNQKSMGIIKEKKKFDWTLISKSFPKEIREVLLNQFSMNKVVTIFDFDFMEFEDNHDFYMFAQKILTYEKDILDDLNLEGKITFSNGVLNFNGRGKIT